MTGKHKYGGDAVRHVLLRALLTGLRQTHMRMERDNKLWNDMENLARTDWPTFVKSERESGSAMYDDPPPDWTLADLSKWSLGYCHGREVETGNHEQEFGHFARLLETALGPVERFGPRRGFPSSEDIRWHSGRTMHGLWYLNEKADKTRSMFGFLPSLICLRTNEKTGEPTYLKGQVWHVVPPKEMEGVISAMPIELDGTPASWKEAKPMSDFGKD